MVQTMECPRCGTPHTFDPPPDILDCNYCGVPFDSVTGNVVSERPARPGGPDLPGRPEV